jgi:hypothetical protein
MHLINFK